MEAYKGLTKERNFINYSLFISFFPKLIAGPIVHHKQIIPQFVDNIKPRICIESIKSGIGIFIFGLFKKIVIADSFGSWADIGFQNVSSVNTLEAWLAVMSFTLQIYFDFSGYVDMAIGSALLLNIRLPKNFDSPYASTNIREFWRKWHITLGNFFKENVYIPLEGNRQGGLNECRNLLFTFGLVGLWHGANWTFVAWGGVHGLAVVFCLFWDKLNFKLHALVSWFLTFIFICVSWVFFKSSDLNASMEMIRHLTNVEGLNILTWNVFTESEVSRFCLMVLPCIALLVLGKNTNDYIDKFSFDHKNITLIFLAILALIIFSIGGSIPVSFIYSAF